MNHRTSVTLAAALGAVLSSGAALPRSTLPVQAQHIQGVERDVIVILRDQLPGVAGAHGAHASRAAAVAAAQVPVMSHLRQSGARNVRSYQLVNAIAATVTESEAAALATHPLVQAVVPDAVIRLQKNDHDKDGGSGGGRTAHGANAAVCNTLEPEALQLTHTAFNDPQEPQAQRMLDGNGLPVTGLGVKVAFIADGLDTTLPGFIRADGTSVFIDYQNFSGDPAGTPTGGGEAFGDASSIAAQDRPYGKSLLFDISQFVNAAHPLPSPCNIRIRGMAPGASLVGLNVFSSLGYTTTSNFVQAIDYAVTQADVDVLNESFGGNPFPDYANDPISLANNAAVRAGVTVVVSTGDAGTAGTLGSPSTESSVIAVGASTQFRFYAQTGYGGAPFAKGYLDNNISSFSSGGFAQRNARTVDVVAPGDLSWALCSLDSGTYQDCGGFNGTDSPVESFGGTSESSPLTAGEAALVIQAYRSTHHNANPSPALVKQIIMSTATDLGAPSSEQGAGLINALSAVNAALSVRDANSSQSASPVHVALGSSVLLSPASARATASPNRPLSQTFTVTNTGSTPQYLSPALQVLGPEVAGATLNLTLDPATDPTFLNVTGAPRSYIEQGFVVPKGVQHLDAAIAYQNPLSSSQIVYMALLDPTGKNAAYTVPQGANSGYGHVDVVSPAPGKWTAIIWTRPAGGASSYSGTVQFTWAAENFVNVGTVTPSHLSLAPGASATFTAQWAMPAQPGDVAASIRFGGAGIAAIPVSLRTLIPTGPTGGSFTGTLTGGNGRAAAGPTQTWEFNVPSGVRDMNLTLQLADNGYLLEGLLVDPNGMQLSLQGNLDPDGNVQYGMSLFRANPQPGRWHFVLLENFTSSGNQTSLPFTARISFNSAQVSGALPNNAATTLSAGGGPVTVPITVVNTGAVAEAYFADARLAAPAVTQLPVYGCSQSSTLPGFCSAFYLPPEISAVEFLAQSNVPITMDTYDSTGYNVGVAGSPDIYAKRVSRNPYTVAATLSKPEIPFGLWIMVPSLVGPYDGSGAQPAPIVTGAYALMKPFDPAVSADSGDLWADAVLGTNTFNPLVLAPGQSGTINVTITPSAAVGSVVSGYVYVDTWNGNVQTGDEVASIPYTYTVAP